MNNVLMWKCADILITCGFQHVPSTHCIIISLCNVHLFVLHIPQEIPSDIPDG